jgi:hypothetical protein
MAHCHRELTHAQLEIILDKEFWAAYAHGIMSKCGDDLFRWFCPQVFIHSADYPEKYPQPISYLIAFHCCFRILMSCIRNRGMCLCPRCTIPLSRMHSLGMKRDRKAWTTLACVDNQQRHQLITSTRKAIYKHNFDVDSAAVECMMKPQSLVPTTVRIWLFRLSRSSSLCLLECLF